MQLTDICNETGLSVDEIRLILMDARHDWETTETITPSEAEIIRRSAQAKLPEGGAIMPVPDMPIEKQEQMISNASQVLGQQLLLSISERVELAGIVDDLTNQVIISNRNTAIRNLASQMVQSDEDIKTEYLNTIATLQSLVKAPEQAPKRVDAIAQAKAAAVNMGKRMIA